MKKRNVERIVVVGLGYIGLPTASMFATKGHQVLGVDLDRHVVETINKGDIHIVEPDLDILVKSAVNSGRLRAAYEPEEADVFILAVPTPFKQLAGSKVKTPDLSYVEAATLSIIPYLHQDSLVILESTSPIGTAEKIHDIIAGKRPELFASSEIMIAHCPERVLPGHIIRELVDNDRIIGGINRKCAEKAKNLYKSFCNGNIYLTDCRTAEIAKLVENSFRDINIAFANELSRICDNLGINVWELIELVNKHPRVNVHQPGPGVGGHCIAVDPWFIVAAAPDDSKLIETARNVNDDKTLWVIEKVKTQAARFHDDPVIGCLGLAYKANIDDLRESPALYITRELISSNIGRIMACEPNLNEEFEEFPLDSLQDVLSESDILVVLVDHDEFKDVGQEMLKEKIVIDTKGIWR